MHSCAHWPRTKVSSSSLFWTDFANRKRLQIAFTDFMPAGSLLGLEIHVSEIQLVLREYYLEPTSHEAIEQHQGYLRLRDLRAERPMWRRVNIARHVRKLTKKLKRILWGPDYPPSRRMDVEMGSGMMSDGTTNVVSVAFPSGTLRYDVETAVRF